MYKVWLPVTSAVKIFHVANYVGQVTCIWVQIAIIVRSDFRTSNFPGGPVKYLIHNTYCTICPIPNTQYISHYMHI